MAIDDWEINPYESPLHPQCERSSVLFFWLMFLFHSSLIGGHTVLLIVSKHWFGLLINCIFIFFNVFITNYYRLLTWQK